MLEFLNTPKEKNLSENAFNFLDLDVTEAIEESRKSNTERNKQICVCGHPIRRHGKNLRGELYCHPNALYCPCKEQRAVLTAQDTRVFLRKTSGGAMLHALTRGLATCVERGIEVEWLISMTCDKCKTETKVVPVPVHQNGAIANDDTGHNALLCNNCRTGN